MSTIRVTSIILVASWCALVYCFPARPLNERSTELAWQAWLLVDDQNQNRQQDSDTLRRRITPKSVFIAPTFSPDSLPACSEGYRPDSMGRCIRIIKIDEASHLEFLLEKLNNKFAGMDYDEEVQETDEDLTTTGPYQVNIPLVEAPNNQQIAIVVAPTNGFMTADDHGGPIKRMPQPDEVNDSSIPGQPILNQPFAISPPENTENTPAEEPTTIATKTTIQTRDTTINTEPSNTQMIDETTESLTSTTTGELTTEEITTSQQALFFRQPFGDGGDDDGAKSLGMITTTEMASSSSRQDPKNSSSVVESTTMFNSVETTHRPLDVRVPTEEVLPFQFNFNSSLVPSNQPLVPSNPPLVFPDSYAKRYQHTLPPTTFQDAAKESTEQLEATTTSRTSPIIFNHRNRDKHINLWSLSAWGEVSPKPIVLRYSRQSATGRHLLAEHLLEPQQKSFYRQVFDKFAQPIGY